jgi:hypothetical protein
MKDWAIRSIKTFVQAFFGVLIPAICTMLNDGWPESWDKIWVVLAPTVAAALAAAICAVWNIIREELDKATTMVDPVEDAKDRLSVEALKSTMSDSNDTVRMLAKDKDAKAAQAEREQQNKDKHGWDGKL